MSQGTKFCTVMHSQEKSCRVQLSSWHGACLTSQCCAWLQWPPLSCKATHWEPSPDKETRWKTEAQASQGLSSSHGCVLQCFQDIISRTRHHSTLDALIQSPLLQSLLEADHPTLLSACPWHGELSRCRRSSQSRCEQSNVKASRGWRVWNMLAGGLGMPVSSIEESFDSQHQHSICAQQ